VRSRFVLATVLVFLFFLPAAARGESLRLKDGKVLAGRVVAWSGNMTEVYFVPEDPREKRRWVPLGEIEHMDSNAFPFQSKERGVPPK
jgi:HD superfamily phosphodiesterase